MSRFLKLVPWALVAGVSMLAQVPALEPVLRAELAFARLAEQKGIRTAFLTCLSGGQRGSGLDLRRGRTRRSGPCGELPSDLDPRIGHMEGPV